MKTSYVGNSSVQQKDDSVTNRKVYLILVEVHVFLDEKVCTVMYTLLFYQNFLTSTNFMKEINFGSDLQ